MAAFIPRTRDELIKHLQEAGFAAPCTVNRHAFMIKNDTRLRIPDNGEDQIGKDLSRKILKQAGLKTE